MKESIYKVVTSLEDLPNFDLNKPIFSDTETELLYVGLRLVQLYQPETSELVYILDTDIIDEELITSYLIDKWLVFHNASYDLGTLKIIPNIVDDTQYLLRNAYPEWQQYSLDNCVVQLNHSNLYEGIDKKEMQKAGFKKGAYLSSRQLKYSALDCIALSLIWKNQRVQTARELLVYKVDILNLRYCANYQLNGLIPHQPSVRKELDSIVDIIESNYEALNGLNPNSPKQVKEALNVESSNKETLIKLIQNGNELAKLVFDQRRLLKKRNFLEQYNYPKVETRFNPAGAVTGRFTSSGGDLPRGINSQQISRGLQYIFNTDTEDTVVIHADYSTAELRAGCSIMGEPTMYLELKEGKDLHKIAATLALGGSPENVTKEERQKGKAISFGYIFGMSAPSFAEYAYTNYGVVFTQEQAKEIKDNYVKRYPNIAKYAKYWWNNYNTEYVKTALGRRAKARLGTDAINFATQGSIAETTKLAVHYLVSENGGLALNYIYNVVHDAIYLRVPKGSEREWSDNLVKAMKKAWVEICKRPIFIYKDIPMPVEVEYNDYSSGEPQYICKEI